MADMLTAKEMQTLLQVDRSTVYRMAEAGQLPAIKVGKQWRFPADQVENWLGSRATVPSPSRPVNEIASNNLAAVLPLECVQLIQDAFAEVLGVMLVTTDLAGRPVTQVSNPFPFYQLLAQSQQGHTLCYEQWQELGQTPALEPRYKPGFAGLLCARALVRFGNELKGMVIAFGLAPQNWPPTFGQIEELARLLQVSPARLQEALSSVFVLSSEEQKRVLITIQRIADILAHIGSERFGLLERLDSIARLSRVSF